MKKILTYIFIFCFFFGHIHALIIETPDLALFEKTVEEISDTQDALVLFDVDETLIIPKDLALRPCARDAWRALVKETLMNPQIVKPENFNEHYFFGQIFSNNEFEIVNPNIVTIVHSLQTREIKAIAFTKMFTGRVGAIPSMEDWRFQQLKQFELDFSSAFPQFPFFEMTTSVPSQDPYPHPAENASENFPEKISLFKQGILCANGQDKGPVLLAFLEKIDWKPRQIIFIDNRLDYLESVEQALEGTGIEFLGFYYTEVVNRPCVINLELMKFQLLHLAETGEWLDDVEAMSW